MDLIDPRTSMIPAGVVTDERIREVDLRVLIAFGAYNENYGWAAPDWPVLARALGCPPEEIISAANNLTALGFLRQMQSKKTGVVVYAATHDRAYAADRRPEPGINFGLRDWRLLEQMELEGGS